MQCEGDQGFYCQLQYDRGNSYRPWSIDININLVTPQLLVTKSSKTIHSSVRTNPQSVLTLGAITACLTWSYYIPCMSTMRRKPAAEGLGSAVVREDGGRKGKCYHVCLEREKISLSYQP